MSTIRRIKILGREPGAWVASAGALLTAVAALGVPFLSAGQAAAAAAAISAAVLVATTRPIAPAMVTGVVSTGAALLAEYELHAPPGAVAAIAAATLSLFALVTRMQVEPQDTAITRS